MKPLLLLDDGRIVFFLRSGTLLLYDPMTKLFSEMETGVSEVALYTGTLLAECLSTHSSIALFACCTAAGGRLVQRQF